MLMKHISSLPAGLDAQYILKNFKETNKNKFENWSPPIPMPRNINTSNNEGAPTLSADGRSLVFVACSDQTGYYGSNREGRGSCDLFFAKKKDQTTSLHQQ